MKSLKTVLNEYKRICWYPSAGLDLWTPLFLNDVKNKLNENETYDIPDCYLFTDYLGDYFINQMIESYENNKPLILNNEKQGYSSEVKILHYEELKPINVLFKRGLVAFDKTENYNRIYLFNIQIKCDELLKDEVLNTTIIYAIVENTAFEIQVLAGNNIEISHFIHKCYGEAFGGGKSTGQSLYDFLEKLKTKYLILDEHYHKNFKEIAIKYFRYQRDYHLLKDLSFDFSETYGWSGYSNVKLYRSDKNFDKLSK